MFDGNLFRFRTYNEFTLKEILYDELWHSTVNNLNDPFEFPFFISRKHRYDNAELLFILDSLKMRTMDDIYSYRNESDRIYPVLREFVDECLDSLEYKIRKDILKTNVCCFSKEHKNSLMWSHYADGMRGLCIVYNKNELIKSGVNLADIKYVDSVDKTNIYDLNLVEVDTKNRDKYIATISAYLDDLYKYSYFKSIDWKYEKEVRSIITHNNDNFIPGGQIVSLGKSAITAIIVGSKMPKYNRDIIQMICKEKNITLYLAEPNLSSFSVSYKKISD
ncbi:DUF2971 domain-containing protein [Photobacterium leiognathi]|uniref:DUF2971 domain-containing protein n=1 Tax=Photobacterium leiognathi TaxID=553611 RepID=UPI00020886EC|nr:DUF2971 domain-containing protein [Photobacterium leiognathi]PSW53644.1 DUF2971 domain-containing protein [Photobacterium leiognathi subsp. mandapamensis]GAA04810.1 hypothetical protein PMSV_1625 [Photobacterium leiognathi subsp. mandapamensis svers.1.1.]